MTSSRACVFIHSDSRVGNKLINTISCIKPPFPPNIDIRKLITKHSFVDKNSGRSPNAFIIYRKAYVDAARKDGYQLPMTVVSSMASTSWGLEPQFVKDEYKKLAKEANIIRNKLIPRNKRKRQKWNIVSFPSPPTKVKSPPSTNVQSPPTPTNNKTKPLTKKKKAEISTTTSNFMPSFDIPYDICSKIEDRYKSVDSDDTTTIDNQPVPTIHPDFNYNEFENFNIPLPIIEETIVPIDFPIIEINNEFNEIEGINFPTFIYDCYPYPSFWGDEFY